MFKKLFPAVKGYGVPSIFASLSVIAETIFEVLLPFLMMKIVDVGIASQDLSYVVRVGLLMVDVYKRQTYTMGYAPYIENQRTFVHVRFVAEAFDCQVSWDQSAKRVDINR